MRFDQLTLHDPEGDLRVRFHAALTMLCGLGASERAALGDGVLGSVTGVSARSTLHLTDGEGRHLTALVNDGRLTATYQDETPAPPPLGALGADPAAARAVMLLSADDLGAATQAVRDNEPAELREAREALEHLTSELDAARNEQQAADDLRRQLAGLDGELGAARDGIARREYALVLAQLERVRAEVAAVDADGASIDADRHVLSNSDAARALVRSWNEARQAATVLSEGLADGERFEQAERELNSELPRDVPSGFKGLVDGVRAATVTRAAIDQRLQSLSVAKLPAPSHPVVAELGLLDQGPLWATADRASEASAALRRLQVSLGGLVLEEAGTAPEVVDEIESAHLQCAAAELAAAAARGRGIAAIGGAFALALVGVISAHLLIPVSVLVAVAASVLGFVLPARRRSAATRVELAALELADATTYLGFHIRRVEATVDPEQRAFVVAASYEHRAALSDWVDLAGAVELTDALAVRDEVQAYNQALQDLGDTAVEIEELRHQLHADAEPALAAARCELLTAIIPYHLTVADLDDLDLLPGAIERRCAEGERARRQIELDDIEVDLEKATLRLEDVLLQIGFDEGALEARVGALEWAIGRATEREEARRTARPREEVEKELQRLQAEAAQRRRPEWTAVTARNAESSDIPELEARREALVLKTNATRPDVDEVRLADRHAASERRVAALEAAQAGSELCGDPSAIAALRQQLLAHLSAASTAGPNGDPVPVVLDEVLLRVSPDRTWDLLDLLLRVAENHQLIYLSDDPFVAAWARKRALEGSVILLELAPELAAQPASAIA